MRKAALYIILLLALPLSAQVSDSLKVEEIRLEPGKPHIVIVAVFAEMLANPDYSYAEREIGELKKNFPELSESIRYINKHLVLKMSDKEFDFSNREDDYTQFLYWSGKVGDEIVVSDRKQLYSEFLGEAIGVKVKSSYVVEFDKKVSELESLRKYNPGTQHELLTDLYLAKMFNDLIYNRYVPLFRYNFKGLKEIVVTTDVKKLNNPFRVITLDGNGHFLKIDFQSDNSDGKRGIAEFVYENGLLKRFQISYNNTVQNSAKYYYNGDKLVEYNGEDYKVYEIENHQLVRSNYYVYSNSFEVSITENKNEENCQGQLSDNDKIGNNMCFSSLDLKNVPIKIYRNNEVFELSKKGGAFLLLQNNGMFSQYFTFDENDRLTKIHIENKEKEINNNLFLAYKNE